MARPLRALGTRFRRLEDRSRWARLKAKGPRLPGPRERRPDEVSDNLKKEIVRGQTSHKLRKLEYFCRCYIMTSSQILLQPGLSPLSLPKIWKICFPGDRKCCILTSEWRPVLSHCRCCGGRPSPSPGPPRHRPWSWPPPPASSPSLTRWSLSQSRQE